MHAWMGGVGKIRHHHAKKEEDVRPSTVITGT